LREHFGEFKVYGDKLDNPIAFHYANTLTFSFDNFSIEVKQINNIAVCNNEEIVIELALFDVNLYNAWVNGYVINTLTEKGTYFDPTAPCDEKEYSTTYKNYRFKSYSGSRENNGHWIYVLEPIK
jgi:hypothetical protein